IRARKFALSSGRITLPTLPSLAGHSQSRSMPSKMPKAEPGPPCSSPPICGRLPLMYRSMQDATPAARFCGSAMLEKYFDQVQPPKEMYTFRCGYFALSCLSWLKLPARGASQVSAVPLTELEELYFI